MRCPTCNGDGEIPENTSFRLRPEQLEVGKFIYFAQEPHKIIAIQFPFLVVQSKGGLKIKSDYHSGMTEVAPSILEVLGGAF